MRLFEALHNSTPKKGNLFGIEIEVERKGGFDGMGSLFEGIEQFGSVTSDGSLRNGIELVSAPLTAEQCTDFAAWYDQFYTKASIELSERCSTHIHVNVQDLTIPQFRSFLWLSIATEPVLMALCSPQRQNNTYCMPVFKSTNLSEFWSGLLGMLQDERPAHALQYLRNAPKYCAIGSFRLRDYGTLEFRMFDGLSSGSQLCTYVQFLEALRDMAKLFTVEQLRDEKHTKGVLSILAPVIATAAASIPDVPALLEKGIEMANDSVRRPMTIEAILAKHQELFPEEAPFLVNRGVFPRQLLAATDLTTILAKVDRSQFHEVYSDVQTLFYDLCGLGDKEDDAFVLRCIDLYIQVKQFIQGA